MLDFDYTKLDSVTQILYAICITVIAISLIYRVCELMVEAHQDLDEEREKEKLRGKRHKGRNRSSSEKD